MDGQFDDLKLCSKYQDCNFAHITREESLKKILESKCILGRFTWNFADTQEYILGLEIILDILKSLDSDFKDNSTSNFNSFLSGFSPKPILSTFSNHEINQLFEGLIELIDYEIKNYYAPRVKIYVSSFINLNSASKNNIKRMTQNYGNCIIHFNYILALIAYSTPRPLTASMLSRVTYNEYEFREHVRKFLSFDSKILQNYSNSIFFNSCFIMPTWQERLNKLCQFILEDLCLQAPNIKNSSFAYENEWRLKSVRSMYHDGILDEIIREKHPSDPSLSYLGMPPTTSFNLAYSPQRVERKLTIKNEYEANTRFICNKVEILADNKELRDWVDDWAMNNALPANFNPMEFLANKPNLIP